jgi:DNA-binding CsgD family transcriptional regulator
VPWWRHNVVPQVRCPTLVLHPRGDTIIPFDGWSRRLFLARGLCRSIPSIILLEQEAEWARFIAELDGFLPTSPAKLDTLLDELSTREKQVLELMAQGLGNSTIPTRLGVTEKTVRNHVSIVFDKLGVNSRAQAIVYAHCVRA